MFASKYPSLSACLCRSEKWFGRFGDTTDTPDGPYIFQDNGAAVLAVAHLDFVLWARPVYSGSCVTCPQLDDRLGAWAILSILPSLGVKVDVLLTTGEECGRSTARHFQQSHGYNWMLEMDRRGTDAVMYDFENGKRRRLLRKYGFQVGQGSYSDICSLSDLGVAGYNFGVGYYAEHTYHCKADLRDTLAQCNKVARFWRAEKDNPQTWAPAPVSSRFNRFGFDWYDTPRARRSKLWDDERRLYPCDGCSAMAERVTKISGLQLCSACVGLYSRRCTDCGRIIIDDAGPALCDECAALSFDPWAKRKW